MGSACFHCTLRHVEQQCDETPMVFTLLNWFYELFADTWEHNSFLSAAMPALLVVYGVVRQMMYCHPIRRLGVVEYYFRRRCYAGWLSSTLLFYRGRPYLC